MRLIAIPLACTILFLFFLGREKGSYADIRLTVKSEPQLLRATNNRSSGNWSTNDPLINVDDGTIIPSCARDVFVTLHKEGGGSDEHACKGMLIRDDILITSNACSKFNFTFDFAGLGVLRAIPHTSLNSRDDSMINSSLGFLEANPPYHYQFSDQPTRRARMFLSIRSNFSLIDTDDPTSNVIMTCTDGKPIAHNFPTKGVMIPLKQLAGVVPDDILWEHTDLYTAPELKYKAERWWTRYIQKEVEEATFREFLEQYDGPPGSVSIPAAHDKFVSAASALCEALDPRGHRRDLCFRNYFTRWQEENPFSGMHFFDWLDFGSGKWLLEADEMEHTVPYSIERDHKCLKKSFNKKKVHYFTDAERKFHEIYIVPSKSGSELIARYKHNDEPVPESDVNKPHLYMWDMNKTMYIVDNRWDKDSYGRIKHSAVLAGRPALSAGKAYFGKNGAIWGINYSSGHYRPGIENISMMYQWMKDQNFNTTALQWVGRSQWSEEACDEVGSYGVNWTTIDIPGYTAEALYQSCHEVTTSPTWVLKDDV